MKFSKLLIRKWTLESKNSTISTSLRRRLQQLDMKTKLRLKRRELSLLKLRMMVLRIASTISQKNRPKRIENNLKEWWTRMRQICLAIKKLKRKSSQLSNLARLLTNLIIIPTNKLKQATTKSITEALITSQKSDLGTLPPLGKMSRWPRQWIDRRKLTRLRNHWSLNNKN